MKLSRMTPQRFGATHKKGHTVGLLTSFAEGGYDADGYALWECRCACGNPSVKVRAEDLRYHYRKTCYECPKFVLARTDGGAS